MKNAFRSLLDSDHEIYGVFVTVSDPAVLELIALSGFNLAVIDLEHSALSLETVANQVRAAKQHDLPVIVRVSDNDAKAILRVLELGPNGILVPHISDGAGARAAADAVRYPPAGHRGFYDGTPAARYFTHGFDTYGELAEYVNKTIVLAVLIEDADGVANIEQIAQTAGVDMAIVGPADLGASLGLLGSPGDSALSTAIDRVRLACRQEGLPFGAPVGHPLYHHSAGELREKGDRIFLAGSDCAVLLRGLRTTLREME